MARTFARTTTHARAYTDPVHAEHMAEIRIGTQAHITACGNTWQGTWTSIRQDSSHALNGQMHAFALAWTLLRTHMHVQGHAAHGCIRMRKKPRYMSPVRTSTHADTYTCACRETPPSQKARKEKWEKGHEERVKREARLNQQHAPQGGHNTEQQQQEEGAHEEEGGEQSNEEGDVQGDD